MIATLSETTAGPFLSKLRDDMLKTDSGRALLRERPRITTKTIHLEELRVLPEESFGRAYVNWLDWCKVTPDTRDPVCLSTLDVEQVKQYFHRSASSTTLN